MIITLSLLMDRTTWNLSIRKSISTTSYIFPILPSAQLMIIPSFSIISLRTLFFHGLPKIQSRHQYISWLSRMRKVLPTFRWKARCKQEITKSFMMPKNIFSALKVYMSQTTCYFSRLKPINCITAFTTEIQRRSVFATNCSKDFPIRMEL